MPNSLKEQALFFYPWLLYDCIADKGSWFKRNKKEARCVKKGGREMFYKG